MTGKIRKIFVAIPSQRDAVNIATMMCILDGMVDALVEGWAFTVKGYAGIAPISACRNFIIAEFMASDCDDLFFVDDDLAWNGGAMVRLLRHPVDFVAGVYPYRADPVNFPVRGRRDKPWIGSPGDLMEVEGVGFGFARLTRSCVERMIAHYPNYWYAEKHAPGGRCPSLFEFVRRENVIWSEDMEFCQKWHRMGGDIWVDPWITFAHIGNKGFVGCFGDMLKANLPVIDPVVQQQAAE